jgi:hypothetical protein
MAHYGNPLLVKSRHLVCNINRDFCASPEFAKNCQTSRGYKWGIEEQVYHNEKLDELTSKALKLRPTDPMGVINYRELIEVPAAERTEAQNMHMYHFFQFMKESFYNYSTRHYLKKTVARRLPDNDNCCILINCNAACWIDLLIWIHHHVVYNTKPRWEREVDMYAYCFQQVGLDPYDLALDELAEYVRPEDPTLEALIFCPMCSQKMESDYERLMVFNGETKTVTSLKCTACFFTNCPSLNFHGDTRILTAVCPPVPEAVAYGNLGFKHIDAFAPWKGNDSDSDYDSDDEPVEDFVDNWMAPAVVDPAMQQYLEDAQFDLA